MKLFLMILLFSFNAFSKLLIPHEAISFKYQSFDGSVVYNCKHVEINEWFDWDVYCGENLEKKYSVHLLLHYYERENAPKSSYELMYWITDSKTKKGTSVTTWVHLEEKSKFYKIESGLSVDDDTAGLYLTLNRF